MGKEVLNGLSIEVQLVFWRIRILSRKAHFPVIYSPKCICTHVNLCSKLYFCDEHYDGRSEIKPQLLFRHEQHVAKQFTDFIISFHILQHVSSHIVLIIRRIYCIYTASGSLCVNLLVWNIKNQMLCIYSTSSLWWAQYGSKHVEEYEKI